MVSRPSHPNGDPISQRPEGNFAGAHRPARGSRRTKKGSGLNGAGSAERNNGATNAARSASSLRSGPPEGTPYAQQVDAPQSAARVSPSPLRKLRASASFRVAAGPAANLSATRAVPSGR